jgi:hypothetical protein
MYSGEASYPEVEEKKKNESRKAAKHAVIDH